MKILCLLTFIRLHITQQSPYQYFYCSLFYNFNMKPTHSPSLASDNESSINIQRLSLYPEDENISVNLESDPLNNAFIEYQGDQSSLEGSLSLHLSQISSIDAKAAKSDNLSKSSRMKRNYSCKYSDVSSIFNAEIKQEEEDSLVDILNDLKRKPSNGGFMEESTTFQFKKKRTLNSNQVAETVIEPIMEQMPKIVRRYPTRRQVLKVIDDKFESEFKKMKGGL